MIVNDLSTIRLFKILNLTICHPACDMIYTYIRTATYTKGIRHVMTDKLMHIPNDDTQNYPFCRLKSVVETFEHST